jgi:hypothetical protein
MKTKNMKLVCASSVTFLFLTLFSYASPPIPFSGKLSLNSQNFEGPAQFSFSIVDQNGTVHWRHSQDPEDSIENYVSGGRYLIFLGGQGMQPISPNLFLTHDSLFLRVSVDLLDGQGSRTLAPDQPITSSPYALAAELSRLAERATLADGVSDGAISHNMLSEEILADLNRTIGHAQLSEDILADLGRTITLSDLSQSVLVELNNTVENGTISFDQLSPGVRAELNRTIERSNLSADILNDLNRTITLSDFSPSVFVELNNTVENGAISFDQLSPGVRAELNRTIERSNLSADILNDLNRTISLSMLGQDVLNEINSSSLSSGSITSGSLDPNLTRYFLPEITSVPPSLSILQGDSTSLSVQASGKFMTYQWYRNGVAIQGAIQPTLSLQDLNASLNEGNYSLVVSNDWGSITSQNVTLSIATALPTIALNGAASITHEAGTPYVDAGSNAADALGNDLNGSIVVTGANFNVSSVGQRTISFSVTDAGGNQNTTTRTVSVVDTTNPSIYLAGGTSYTHGLNSAWTDPGYEANDTVDGNLTSSVLISGTVDVNTSGTYTLVYSVSDTAGNDSNITRSVSVQASGPWTFTNAGVTGRNGPTQAQVSSAYTGTSLDSAVTINTQGIQEWTVPASGTYSIEVWGASGGTNGGLGAKIVGSFTLAANDLLKLAIGQMGTMSSAYTDSSGGGGGSFVVKGGNALLVAGGGGGGTRSTNTSLVDGSINSSGNNDSGVNPASTGGTNGNGGNAGGVWGGSGGGGFLANGSNGYSSNTEMLNSGGKSWANGLLGGINSDPSYNYGREGGFGGGGASSWASGGGGGYSGGAGKYSAGSGSEKPSGGGGGSFNSGVNQNNSAGVNNGHGKVVITFISN